MTDAHGLSIVQLTILTGTVVIANLAAIWLIRRNFFKSPESSEKGSNVLDVEEWKEFELVEKEILTHNTAIYRFKLPTEDSVLPLPIGQHVQLAAIWNEKEVVRSYTPITLDDTKGHFDLLVKTYDQGNASQYLSSLKIGEKARFRGPKGKFLYKANMAKEIGMIAGGTGITPILQVIKAVLRNPEDETKLSLIFGNLSKEDILLYQELKELAQKHSSQFKVHFVINNPPSGEDWDGSVGYITGDVIKAHCPGVGDDTKILMCGPPSMMTAMTKILVEEVGFKAQSVPPSTEDQIQRF